MTASVTLSHAALYGWMQRVLQRFGMFAVDAELVMARVLEAERRGQVQAGLAQLAEIVTAFDLGDIDPRARTLTKLDLPGYALLDGSTGVGQVGASRAMQLAIEKAKTAGIALVVVNHSQPCGDPLLYSEMAAQAGCLGFCTTNSGKAFWPPQAETRLFASHPQAWAIPAGPDAAWVSRQSIGPESLPEPTFLQGLVSLAFTAGLAGGRLPGAKKKASPFGAGAEHACLAIHGPTVQPESADARWSDSLLQSDYPGWTRVNFDPLPETWTISAETWEALTETAKTSRIPLPEQ